MLWAAVSTQYSFYHSSLGLAQHLLAKVVNNPLLYIVDPIVIIHAVSISLWQEAE